MHAYIHTSMHAYTIHVSPSLYAHYVCTNIVQIQHVDVDVNMSPQKRKYCRKRDTCKYFFIPGFCPKEMVLSVLKTSLSPVFVYFSQLLPWVGQLLNSPKNNSVLQPVCVKPAKIDIRKQFGTPDCQQRALANPTPYAETKKNIKFNISHLA